MQVSQKLCIKSKIKKKCHNHNESFNFQFFKYYLAILIN